MGGILDTGVKLGLIESDARCEVAKKKSIWSFREVFPFHNVVNENFQFVRVCNLQVVALSIFLNHIAIRREGSFGFPCCFFDWISFPLDVILISSSSSSVFEDGFDFINFFSLKQFRGWFWEIISVSFVFDVWAQQDGMEYVMDSPGFR